MAKIDLKVNKDRLERVVQRARETKDHHPDLCPDEESRTGSGQD